MRYLILAAAVLALAACASQPTQCFTNHGPGLSISGVPGQPDVSIPSQTVIVCITPPYVEVAASAPATGAKP